MNDIVILFKLREAGYERGYRGSLILPVASFYWHRAFHLLFILCFWDARRKHGIHRRIYFGVLVIPSSSYWPNEWENTRERFQNMMKIHSIQFRRIIIIWR